jgi:hypothetical protein
MSSDLSEGQNIAVGAVAAFTQATILQPTIFWKNAAQQGIPFTLNPCIVYRGMAAGLVNEAGQMGFQFGAAGFLKKTFGSSPSGDMLSAMLAGVAISPFVQGCEVTMIQQQRFGGSLLRTPQRLVKDFGIRSLFRGYTPMIGREVIWTTGMLGTTPMMQKWLMQEKGWSLNAAESTASLANGVVVGILSCPLDAMSTIMKGDLEQKTYGGFLSTLRKRLAGGPRMFFGGVFWRSVNVAGTIWIANAVRCRVEPLVVDHNNGELFAHLHLPKVLVNEPRYEQELKSHEP